MKIPLGCAQLIQWGILFLNLPKYAEMSPLDFIEGKFSDIENGSCHHWQVSVDIIYRLLVSELIQMWKENYLSLENAPPRFKRPYDFCLELARRNPFDGDEATTGPMVAWYGPLFVATDLTKSLVTQHGLIGKWIDAPINEAFIENIETLFEAHGVPWDDTPLIPIRS